MIKLGPCLVLGYADDSTACVVSNTRRPPNRYVSSQQQMQQPTFKIQDGSTRTIANTCTKFSCQLISLTPSSTRKQACKRHTERLYTALKKIHDHYVRGEYKA